MKELEIIKEVIQKTIGENLSRIILFGSRARGDYNENSDYDLMIILKDEIERNKILEILRNIRQYLSEKFIYVDLIIKSENEFNQFSKIIGTTSHFAYKEGLKL